MAPTRKLIILALIIISLARLYCVDAIDPEKRILRNPAKSPSSRKAAKVVYGVFMLCERASRAPLAFMRTSGYRLRVTHGHGFCRKQIVTAIRPKSRKARNHAKLWPFRRQEFKELKWYREMMFLCTSGRVMVQVRKRKGWATICKVCSLFLIAFPPLIFLKGIAYLTVLSPTNSVTSTLTPML